MQNMDSPANPSSQFPSPPVATVARPWTRVALNYGLIVGVALGVIQILLDLVSAPFFSTFGFGSWILWALGFGVAGFLAAQKTGRASAGTMGGFWAALVGGILMMVYGLILSLVSADTARIVFQQALDSNGNSLHWTLTNAQVVGISLLFFGSFFALSLGFGALFGLLGGLIGRSQSPLARQQTVAY